VAVAIVAAVTVGCGIVELEAEDPDADGLEEPIEDPVADPDDDPLDPADEDVDDAEDSD
jgi:hypothetical protein